MQEKKIIAGLYPRVSTEDQSRYGHSLDEQEDRLKKLCDYKKYEIYKIYREEGVSAKSMKRPKFQEMIEDMKSGKINKIIVYKLDRLTRSIQDLESIFRMIEENDCSLESVSRRKFLGIISDSLVYFLSWDSIISMSKDDILFF